MARALPLLWLSLLGCSDTGWDTYRAERDYLECRFEEVCGSNTAGLDCEAYLASYEALPSPCERFDAFYADSCIDQLETLLTQVRSDAQSCPRGTARAAPACKQAFIESAGGPCRPPLE